MRRLLAVAAVALLAGGSAAFGATQGSEVPASEARARAWAVHVSVSAGQSGSLVVAGASANAGPEHSATAGPLIVNGTGPYLAQATDAVPDDVKTPWTYTDQTGSISMEGWFSEAHAPPSSATARAGLHALTGSGFALANELFTWEQQEELLGQWMQINDLVTSQLNAALAPLAPATSALGLELPVITGISPLGLVDFAGAREVASGAETSANPGYASARADTTLARLNLFGGFIEAHGISAEAVSEDVAGEHTLEARARIERLSIAGVEVEIDDRGLRVAGNDLVSRTVTQPALDAALELLRAGGIAIRAIGTHEDGSLREAGVLEVSVSTPAGVILVSLAHAEASATAASTPPVEVSAGSAAAPAPAGPAIPTVELARSEPEVEAAPVLETTGVPSAQGPGGPLGRTLGPAAARGARTAFLVLALGGALGGVMLPFLIGNVALPRRR